MLTYNCCSSTNLELKNAGHRVMNENTLSICNYKLHIQAYTYTHTHKKFQGVMSFEQANCDIINSQTSVSDISCKSNL